MYVDRGPQCHAMRGETSPGSCPRGLSMGQHRGRRPILNRYAVLFVAGAAIFALDASAASAQDSTRARPRSSKRIPIAKEAPGEVAPRVDTVTVYKTDTLTMQRVDTVRLTRTQTVTKYDTVTKLVLPPKLRQIGGLYIGLAGGSPMPAANFNDSDKPGWRLEVPIGIDPI